MLRRRRRRAEPEAPPQGLWALTYGDLVTQLLAFFILLFSISILDAQKYRAALASFGANLGALPAGPGLLPAAGPAPLPPPTDPQSAADLEDLRRRVQAAFRQHGLAGEVQVESGPDRLLIRFPDRALFDPGRADLVPAARVRLDALVPVLREIPNLIRVEGHTDSDPIMTGLFPSNWELSGARAATVVRYFTEFHGLAPERFDFAGKGEHYPVAPNTSPENKAKNRRVDILILTRPAR